MKKSPYLCIVERNKRVLRRAIFDMLEQGRREYQLTLMEVRASEGLAEMRGEAVTPKPLEDIRKAFENEHGSRFIF